MDIKMFTGASSAGQTKDPGNAHVRHWNGQSYDQQCPCLSRIKIRSGPSSADYNTPSSLEPCQDTTQDAVRLNVADAECQELSV